jgi:hypothetical protein
MRIQNGLPVQVQSRPSVGAKEAESGGKDRQIRRPFHPDVHIPRIHNLGEKAAQTRAGQSCRPPAAFMRPVEGYHRHPPRRFIFSPSTTPTAPLLKQ